MKSLYLRLLGHDPDYEAPEGEKTPEIPQYPKIPITPFVSILRENRDGTLSVDMREALNKVARGYDLTDDEFSEVQHIARTTESFTDLFQALVLLENGVYHPQTIAERFGS